MNSLIYRDHVFSVINPHTGLPFPMEDMSPGKDGAENGVVQVKMPSGTDFAVKIHSFKDRMFFKCLMMAGDNIVDTHPGLFRDMVIRGNEDSCECFHFVSASKRELEIHGRHADYDKTVLNLAVYPVRVLDSRCPRDAKALESDCYGNQVMMKGRSGGVTGGLITSRLTEPITTEVYAPPGWRKYEEAWHTEASYDVKCINVKLQLVCVQTDEEKEGLCSQAKDVEMNEGMNESKASESKRSEETRFEQSEEMDLGCISEVDCGTSPYQQVGEVERSSSTKSENEFRDPILNIIAKKPADMKDQLNRFKEPGRNHFIPIPIPKQDLNGLFPEESRSPPKKHSLKPEACKEYEKVPIPDLLCAANKPSQGQQTRVYAQLMVEQRQREALKRVERFQSEIRAAEQRRALLNESCMSIEKQIEKLKSELANKQAERDSLAFLKKGVEADLAAFRKSMLEAGIDTWTNRPQPSKDSFLISFDEK